MHDVMSVATRGHAGRSPRRRARSAPVSATAEHLALLSDLAHLFNEVPLATSLRLAASNSETYAPLTKGAPDA